MWAAFREERVKFMITKLGKFVGNHKTCIANYLAVMRLQEPCISRRQLTRSCASLFLWLYKGGKKLVSTGFPRDQCLLFANYTINSSNNSRHIGVLRRILFLSSRSNNNLTSLREIFSKDSLKSNSRLKIVIGHGTCSSYEIHHKNLRKSVGKRKLASLNESLDRFHKCVTLENFEIRRL